MRENVPVNGVGTTVSDDPILTGEVFGISPPMTPTWIERGMTALLNHYGSGDALMAAYVDGTLTDLQSKLVVVGTHPQTLTIFLLTRLCRAQAEVQTTLRDILDAINADRKNWR